MRRPQAEGPRANGRPRSGSCLGLTLALSLVVLLGCCQRAWSQASDLTNSQQQQDPQSQQQQQQQLEEEQRLMTWTRWPRVNVSSAAGPTAFGFVATAGDAFSNATVNQKVCGLIASKDATGAAFDRGQQMRIYFLATVAVGNIQMAADLEYLSARSMHQLCYTPPTVGTYRLELRMVFDNTVDLVNEQDKANNGGFTDYALVAMAHVPVVVSPDADPAANYSIWDHRASLPLCTAGILAKSGNRGFWVGNTWVPAACRLTRMEPLEMLQCLDGKRVLMIGDSEVRYLFGLLNIVANAENRSEVMGWERRNPFQRGSLMDTLGVPKDDPPVPPTLAANGEAESTTWEFLGGNSSFWGSIYHGFSRRQVDYSLDDSSSSTSSSSSSSSKNVKFDLTYSSYFTIAKPIFEDWKLSGNFTQGLKVTDGDPYDMVLVANQLHDVGNFATVFDYVSKLVSYGLPNLKAIVKDPGSFFMYGGLTSYEDRKRTALFVSGNPRIVAMENAGYEAVTGAGLPNFLLVRPVTSPRRDLAYDSTHYKLPVNLAMLDLWLGSYCPSENGAI